MLVDSSFLFQLRCFVISPLVLKPFEMQLPAYVLPGLTLVISPLVALMADQLQHLPPLLSGGLINSSQVSSWIFMVLNSLGYDLCIAPVKATRLLQRFTPAAKDSLAHHCSLAVPIISSTSNVK